MKKVTIEVKEENGNKTMNQFNLERDLQARDLMEILLKELKTNDEKAKIIELIKSL